MMASAPHTSVQTQPQVRAWDLPTRLFHWALVLCVASAWVSYRFAEVIGDTTLVWHRCNGLFILTLLVWRVLWGFAGSSTARFQSFVSTPVAAFDYAVGLVRGTAGRYLGHNPLGAWMILAFLAALFTQAGLGLFATDDNDLTGGPLYRLVDEATNAWATRWHGRVFHYVILPLVAIHIAANLLYGAVKKEPLIAAMVTGSKPAVDYADGSAANLAARPVARAALCLVAAASIVLGTIFGMGGKL